MWKKNLFELVKKYNAESNSFEIIRLRKDILSCCNKQIIKYLCLAYIDCSKAFEKIYQTLSANHFLLFNQMCSPKHDINSPRDNIGLFTKQLFKMMRQERNPWDKATYMTIIFALQEINKQPINITNYKALAIQSRIKYLNNAYSLFKFMKNNYDLYVTCIFELLDAWYLQGNPSFMNNIKNWLPTVPLSLVKDPQKVSFPNFKRNYRVFTVLKLMQISLIYYKYTSNFVEFNKVLSSYMITNSQENKDQFFHCALDIKFLNVEVNNFVMMRINDRASKIKLVLYKVNNKLACMRVIYNSQRKLITLDVTLLDNHMEKDVKEILSLVKKMPNIVEIEIFLPGITQNIIKDYREGSGFKFHP